MKYKDGDIVLQTESCSSTVMGEVYPVRSNGTGLWITGKGGHSCNCDYNWEPVYTGEYKVGDTVKIVKDLDHEDPEEVGEFYMIETIDLDRKHPYILANGTAAMECELELVTRKEEDPISITYHGIPVIEKPECPKDTAYFINDVYSNFIPAVDKYGWYQTPGETPELKEPLNKLLNKKGGLMAQLSRLAKKTFDPDTRVLIEAGVLNQDLTVSSYELILEVVLEANKKAIATLAREVLKERAEAAKRCC